MDQELIDLLIGFIVACITEADGYEHEGHETAYHAIDALSSIQPQHYLRSIWDSIDEFKEMINYHNKHFDHMIDYAKFRSIRAKNQLLWQINWWVEEIDSHIPEMPKSQEDEGEEGKRKFHKINNEHDNDYMEGDEEWTLDDDDDNEEEETKKKKTRTDPPAAVTPPAHKKQKIADCKNTEIKNENA